MESGRAVYFTDSELLELRRILLPAHMARHDSSAETKLRSATKGAEERIRQHRPPLD